MGKVVTKEINGVLYQIDTERGYATVTGCAPRAVDLEIEGRVEFEGSTYPVFYIKNDAFAGNTELKSVIILEKMRTKIDTAEYTDVEVSGTTIIGDRAFAGCENLERVVLPHTLLSIWDNAFYNCKKLNDIDLHDSLELIGNEAFAGCEALTRVVIPDSVKALGRIVFSHCISLENVTIGEGVSIIPQYAFRNCYKLKNITADRGNVVYIDDCAFLGCTAIESIALKHMGHIHDRAFKDATGLDKITFTEEKGCICMINTGTGERVC